MRNGTSLDIAGSGLMRGLNRYAFVGLAFDLDNSGEGAPQPGVLRFDIFADGRAGRTLGNDAGFTAASSGTRSQLATQPAGFLRK